MSYHTFQYYKPATKTRPAVMIPMRTGTQLDPHQFHLLCRRLRYLARKLRIKEWEERQRQWQALSPEEQERRKRETWRAGISAFENRPDPLAGFFKAGLLLEKDPKTVTFPTVMKSRWIGRPRTSSLQLTEVAHWPSILVFSHTAVQFDVFIQKNRLIRPCFRRLLSFRDIEGLCPTHPIVLLPEWSRSLQFDEARSLKLYWEHVGGKFLEISDEMVLGMKPLLEGGIDWPKADPPPSCT